MGLGSFSGPGLLARAPQITFSSQVFSFRFLFRDIYIYIYVRDPGMVAILVKALFCSGMVGGPSRAWPKRIASKKRGVSPHNVARVIYVPSVSIHLRVLIASLHLSRVFSFSL